MITDDSALVAHAEGLLPRVPAPARSSSLGFAGQEAGGQPPEGEGHHADEAARTSNQTVPAASGPLEAALIPLGAAIELVFEPAEERANGPSP